MDYHTRQKQLINHLEKVLETDIAIILSPINIAYYTGFHFNPHERFFALVVDTKNKKTLLFLPSLDESTAKEQAKVDTLIPISDTDNAYKKFVHNIGTSLQSIAYEKSYITVKHHEQFAHFYSKVKFKNIENFIATERMKKSPDEIKHVKESIQITEKGLTNTLEKIRTGMTELQIKVDLEY